MKVSMPSPRYLTNGDDYTEPVKCDFCGLDPCDCDHLYELEADRDLV